MEMNEEEISVECGLHVTVIHHVTSPLVTDQADGDSRGQSSTHLGQHNHGSGYSTHE